jgi:hypothetical protein
MTQLTFTQENLPTLEEFRRLLLEAWLSSNPVDELLELAERLREYEQRYGMSSSDFYERYQRGEMGDEREIMRWAILYGAFIEHRSRVEAALTREAILHTEAVPA